MYIRIASFAFMMSVLAIWADEPPSTGVGFGAGNSIQIQSTNVLARAWKRSVVTVDMYGVIRGDEGKVGAKVETDAINTAADMCTQISDAAVSSMNGSMSYLHANTNNMNPHCVMTAIHVAPESICSNLTGYVVLTTTTNNVDYQYVWYDRALSLKPVRYVCYSYFGGTQDVKCVWQNWTTNGVNVTVNGRTWSGCHLCTVQRPSFAQGERCLDLPNERWGGKSGMEWGDMALKMDGNDLYTGFVTNGITGDVLYFDSGFLKPIPAGAETP